MKKTHYNRHPGKGICGKRSLRGTIQIRYTTCPQCLQKLLEEIFEGIPEKEADEVLTKYIESTQIPMDQVTPAREVTTEDLRCITK